MTFSNKTVVITGGSGALGVVASQAFLDRGAVVHASYVLARERARLPESLTASDRFHLTEVDLTRESSVCSWFDRIGALDVLVNIAGGFSMAPFIETELEAWRKMQDMNLTTTFLTCREGLKRMDPERDGRIINVAAYAAVGPTSGMAAYTVSKCGVLHLTRTLAEETLNTKVTVNAVLPTILDTPANRESMPDADFSTWTPLENAAHTILFLAEPMSWHVTGACIPLRGHC